MWKIESNIVVMFEGAINAAACTNGIVFVACHFLMDIFLQYTK